MLKIVAFSGKLQSGKTTAVDALKKQIAPHAIVNFADPLKHIIASCFTNAERLQHGEELFTTEASKNRRLPCGKSARELLQLVGTEWFRGIDPYCWVRVYRRTVGMIEKFTLHGQQPPVIITSDVRFENEVECVQEMGGHVIRLTRCPFPDDKHSSETDLDAVEAVSIEYHRASGPDLPEYRPSATPIFDEVLDNSLMSVQLQTDAIDAIITERKWL